ncbi:MAG: glycosyl hydrolase, partial [Acidobacteriota bacterium]
NTAYILSIGNGDSSRIYKTTDGGKTWTLQFKNTNEKAFFDALACRDRGNCLALSDPLDGKFLLLGPKRGGLLARGARPELAAGFEDYGGPEAKDGEAAFAASGTCLVTQGLYKTFIVSGGKHARVFQREDDGAWTISEPGFAAGSTGSGIFSVAMFDLKNGVIVGGDYEKPDEAKNNLAFTSDGGRTWKLGSGLNGYRSSVSYASKNILVAAGTNGSDISYDGGLHWEGVDKENYNAVQAKSTASIWAVGPKGRVAQLPIITLIKSRKN